jgi:predicted ATP-grasp superfamily ATP-dependent carboligase
MNLLVTNTGTTTAYVIIRALRPHAQKIIATEIQGLRSRAAYSRLVDKRYYVPSPMEDWKAGNITKENTEREEAYIQAIQNICETEKIDTIYPSHDAYVYVFSKNNELFKKMGVLIPIPDYETVITPLDKYRTTQAAERVGFPCPRTYLPESDKHLKRIAEDLGFPLMVRPRFTSGGRGMEMVKDLAELLEKTRLVRAKQGLPMIQEYIPGRRNHSQSSFRLVVDKEGDLKVCFCTRRLLNLLRLGSGHTKAQELSPPGSYLEVVTKLIHEIGIWGGVSVATKVDPRDGLPKLMEINMRFGTRLWHMTELGINAPLMCIQIAKGEKVESVEEYPTGTIFTEPVEELLQSGFWLFDSLFYNLSTRVLRRPVGPVTAPMSWKQVIQSYREMRIPDQIGHLFRSKPATPLGLG